EVVRVAEDVLDRELIVDRPTNVGGVGLLVEVLVLLTARIGRDVRPAEGAEPEEVLPRDVGPEGLVARVLRREIRSIDARCDALRRDGSPGEGIVIRVDRRSAGLVGCVRLRRGDRTVRGRTVEQGKAIRIGIYAAITPREARRIARGPSRGIRHTA